ncbi:MAG: nuclear transport factor 2 family protein [Arenimonas sp.]
METLNTLDDIRMKHPDVPAAGSAEESAAIENFKRFFSSFSVDRIDTLLAKTYANDVYFNDTLKTIRGMENLSHYLKESAAAVEDCRVEVLEVTRNEHGDHYFRWKMLIRFKRFKKGQDTWTVGMSHLRFNAYGLVVYHQDYWNATDGLFRHIPILGSMINAVIKRL